MPQSADFIFHEKVRRFWFFQKDRSLGHLSFDSLNPSSLFILRVAVFCALFISLARLFMLTVVNGEKYRSLAEENRVRLVTIEAARGKIFDRNGALLYEFYTDQNRTPMPFSDIPQYIKDATIAIEDREFYRHSGFSVKGMIRAVREISVKGQVQGGSTITQQLIKSALLSPEIKLSRKIKEIVLAFWAERMYTKEQILEMYLNQVPYGGTSWGIESASRTYFGKSVKDLSLAESSLLAGLPAAPTEYSPFGTHPEKAFQRQAEVLRRMVEDRYITKEEAEEILSSLKSSFNQFDNTLGNALEWEKAEKSDLRGLVRNFSFRIFDDSAAMPMNLREVTSIMHFHTKALSASEGLRQSRSATAPAPLDIGREGILLGINKHRNIDTEIRIAENDRLRHFYCIGQTGTGKTTLLKKMIIQDMQMGHGVCMIDPHGSDLQDILANVPKERHEDVIYFDPAYTARPSALNMLEYDENYPEQKTFVVNELFSIFQKLYGAIPESMGPAFEQYFRNSALLVMDDPSSGNTLVDMSRVLSNKTYRDLKISKCKNPLVKQFWVNAEKTTGEQGLANYVQYVTNKFDVFLANDIMRPVIAQEKSSFNFREIMDNKKILLVNLSKGRLGDINANLIGLILVGKILIAALSRSDMTNPPQGGFPPFYLYIDEFQNITTDSIATILSEARKYKLSLNIAHQFIAQLEENIKNAVFGNVGSVCAFRVGAEDAESLENQFVPTFSARDLMNMDNLNAYLRLLVNGKPAKPFNIFVPFPPKGDEEQIEKLKEMSYIKYGAPREEVEKLILEKYKIL